MKQKISTPKKSQSRIKSPHRHSAKKSASQLSAGAAFLEPTGLMHRVILGASSILILLSVTMGVLAIFQPRVNAYVKSTTWPIVMLHGFSNTSIDDCAGTFARPQQYLRLHGWTGPTITLGYYTGDTNCTTSVVNWSALHEKTDHCAQYYAGQEGTNKEDLRHVACELDRYLWNNWWSRGWNVDIMAHSMGGLISRWALGSRDTALPSVRYVQDVTTTGTPHEGMTQLLPCGCTQSVQMYDKSPGSFMFQIQLIQNPQGKAGTNWTMIGSTCDGNTALGMDGGTKVRYSNPCYLHPNYYNDTSASNNAVVTYSIGKPRDIVNQSSNTWSHSLHYLTRIFSGLAR